MRKLLLPIFSRSKKAFLLSKMILSRLILMRPWTNWWLMAVNDDMAIANLPRASSESFSISFSSDPGKETEITCQHFLMLGLTGSNNFPTSLRPETGLDLKYRISPLDLHKTQLLGVLRLEHFEVRGRKFQFGNSDRRHYLESSKCSSTTVHQSNWTCHVVSSISLFFLSSLTSEW